MKTRLSTILELEREAWVSSGGRPEYDPLRGVLGRNTKTGHVIIIENVSLVSNSVQSLNLSTGQIHNTTLDILDKLVCYNGRLTYLEEARIEQQEY